jgi:hypothetical protein
MKIGIGGLKWRPADFWAATLTEFFDAITGHNASEGGEAEEKAPSQDEMAALIAKYS